MQCQRFIAKNNSRDEQLYVLLGSQKNASSLLGWFPVGVDTIQLGVEAMGTRQLFVAPNLGDVTS